MRDEKLYVIKNTDKKSVYCTETWYNDETDESFYIEEMFRWGETVLWLDEDDLKEIQNDIAEGNPIIVSHYTIEDQNLDDGCAMDFYSAEDDQELVERVEKIWENDFYSGLEDAGFFQEDAEVVYHGPCTIEEVKDGK